jgi:hypothetical protein
MTEEHGTPSVTSTPQDMCLARATVFAASVSATNEVTR